MPQSCPPRDLSSSCLASQPLIPVPLPSSHCSSAHQTCSCLRAFASAVPFAWSTVPGLCVAGSDVCATRGPHLPCAHYDTTLIPFTAVTTQPTSLALCSHTRVCLSCMGEGALSRPRPFPGAWCRAWPRADARQLPAGQLEGCGGTQRWSRLCSLRGGGTGQAARIPVGRKLQPTAQMEHRSSVH